LANKDLVRFIYCQSNENDTSDILYAKLDTIQLIFITEHDVFSQLLLLLRLLIVKMYDVNSLTEHNENISLNMQVDNSISNDKVNLLSSDIFNDQHHSENYSKEI